MKYQLYWSLHDQEIRIDTELVKKFFNDLHGMKEDDILVMSFIDASNNLIHEKHMKISHTVRTLRAMLASSDMYDGLMHRKIQLLEDCVDVCYDKICDLQHDVYLFDEMVRKKTLSFVRGCKTDSRWSWQIFEDKITQFSAKMASEDLLQQPTTTIPEQNRSDWFRQTVLFWSSQTTNRESGSEFGISEYGSRDHDGMTTSDFSSTECESTTSLTNTNDDGEAFLLDLDITTSELLKQVEEFEHCFTELTKKDEELCSDITSTIKTEKPIDSLPDELNEDGSTSCSTLLESEQKVRLHSLTSELDKGSNATNVIVDSETRFNTLDSVSSHVSAYSDCGTLESENQFSTLGSEKHTYTRSPHLTLEFPTGSSIRDSPLYTISDRVTASTALGNKMDCSADRPADDAKDDKIRTDRIRAMISNGEMVENNCLTNELLITCDETPPRVRSEKVLNSEAVVDESFDMMDDESGSEKSGDNRGDPNDVLRDILSGIKPPIGVSSVTASPRTSKTMEPVSPVSPVPGTNTAAETSVVLSSSKVKEQTPELPVKTCKHKSKKKAKEEVKSPAKSPEPILKNTEERKSDVLLKQMDNLLEMEHKRKSDAKKKLKNNSHEKLERLDSGLNGMSSDSNSPYPSPAQVHRSPTSSDKLRHKSPGYDSGYVEPPIRNISETIVESSKEQPEWDFPDDSDLSSDWSPLSTIDSADFSVSSKRSRAYSVPHGTQLGPHHNGRRSSTPSNHKKGRSNSTALSKSSLSPLSRFEESPSVDVMYSETELSAIRKFLTLTRKYFDKGSGKASNLDELAMLPNINEIVEQQSKDVRDQREMLEGFIRQLGELLIEVVNIKDEQSAVRTKQAKALTLLKKQLDHHKKTQSQTCNDILEQVNLLNEKLNSNLSTEQLCSTPISKSASVKSVMTPSKSPSPSLKSTTSTKTTSPNTSALHQSTTSLGTPSSGLRPSNYGQIIWKITDVMRKITRIKSGVIDGTLVSSPFQTGEYEYNMNAWLYLNGRGKMVGKYLSVYTCVLVGEYDAILPWPVTPTYRFTLIDQRSDPTKRQDHVRVRRVLDIAGRGENVISQNGGIPRPSDGSKALIVGLDDFIAHDMLLKNRYLVDDVIFLKVEAEIN